MQHAIGIAATQVTGVREMFGSHTKAFHPGRAAQNGLLAAILASNGYTSSLQALEAKRGWANLVSTSVKLDPQIESLGRVWEISKNAFKPFPCGIVIHPVIDGCIQLHHKLAKDDLDVANIQSIAATVHPLVLELTGKRKPKDGLEGKFSVLHGGAVGLLYGKASPAQYEDAVVQDSKVIDLRDKIQATSDSSMRADATRIVVKFTDGTTLEKNIDHAVGSAEVPMSNTELQEKFLDQCQPVLGADVSKKASDLCWGLERVADVCDISMHI